MSLNNLAEPTKLAGVYLAPSVLLDEPRSAWLIDGRPVRAIAPHPERDDVVYLTTESPELLDFLPDPALELS
jgi:hypothetical protein